VYVCLYVELTLVSFEWNLDNWIIWKLRKCVMVFFIHAV
jgi:hypothetical protein